MTDKPRVARIDPLAPDPELIKRASDIIAGGGLVIYPTMSLYGLGADAEDPKAVEKIFEVKKREPENPVSILIADRLALDRYAKGVSDAAEKVMDRFWPGGITLVFRAKPGLPPILTAGTHTVGIRLPFHPVASALAKTAAAAITATSANLSGRPAAGRISDIGRDLTETADLVLDAGTLDTGPGSTILDVTCDPPKILRQGRVKAEDLQKVIRVVY